MRFFVFRLQKLHLVKLSKLLNFTLPNYGQVGTSCSLAGNVGSYTQRRTASARLRRELSRTLADVKPKSSLSGKMHTENHRCRTGS